MMLEKPINWRVFWVLLAASVFGNICIIPYTLTLQAGLLEDLPVPLYLLLMLQIAENIVIFAILIFVGMYLAGKVDIRAPILELWSQGEKIKSVFKSVL
ncbi:MAG: CPBP family intramembrane glutamate endopeptidase, partial [Candidatus Bathyarchaeia archaeon]